MSYCVHMNFIFDGVLVYNTKYVTLYFHICYDNYSSTKNKILLIAMYDICFLNFLNCIQSKIVNCERLPY